MPAAPQVSSRLHGTLCFLRRGFQIIGLVFVHLRPSLFRRGTEIRNRTKDFHPLSAMLAGVRLSLRRAANAVFDNFCRVNFAPQYGQIPHSLLLVACGRRGALCWVLSVGFVSCVPSAVSRSTAALYGGVACVSGTLSRSTTGSRSFCGRSACVGVAVSSAGGAGGAGRFHSRAALMEIARSGDIP